MIVFSKDSVKNAKRSVHNPETDTSYHATQSRLLGSLNHKPLNCKVYFLRYAAAHFLPRRNASLSNIKNIQSLNGQKMCLKKLIEIHRTSSDEITKKYTLEITNENITICLQLLRIDQVDHFWLFFKATWRKSMLTSRNSDRHVQNKNKVF